jgi:hypothetical protein
MALNNGKILETLNYPRVNGKLKEPGDYSRK